jgi:hypothetical protein
MALTLLAVYALDYALLTNRRRYWALFAYALAAAVLFHYLAGILLVALAAFLTLRWRQLPPGRRGLAGALAVLAIGALAFVLLRAGPRGSLTSLLATRLDQPWRAAAIEPLVTRWALGPHAEGVGRVEALLFAVGPWLLVIAGIVAMARPKVWTRPNLQALFALLVFTPPLVGWAAMVHVEPRHHSALYGVFVIALALGIMALYKRSRWIGAAVLAVLLTGYTFLSYQESATGNWRSFSVAARYITERAGDDETLVYTYYFDRPLDQFYNTRGLAAEYIPPTAAPITDEEIEEMAREALASAPAVWLNLYPGPPETAKVEAAFDRLAFPADKRWFPLGRGVVHYLAPVELLEQEGGVTWDGGMALDRWWAEPGPVDAGKGLRFQFEWRKAGELPANALVALTLVDVNGQVWARRVGEPCNGGCPTGAWGDEPILDRQALYISGDVPPGSYQVRLAWVTPGGETYLARRPGDDVATVDIELMKAAVQQPVTPPAVVPPLATAVGAPIGKGLAFLGYEAASREAQAGATWPVALQFRVDAPLPGNALDLHLVLTRDGQETHVAAPAGLAPAGGGIIRAQPVFAIPGTLAAGEYRAEIGASAAGDAQLLGRAPLGALTISDRPRRFEAPAVGAPVDAQWAEGVTLIRAETPETARPGDDIPITLVWQAGGPTARNWKVFVHLLNGAGGLRAQVDSYPAEGAAPSTSWQANEVILDTRRLALPADLEPGSYNLRVGLYDELTGERLPLAEGGDSVTLPRGLVVESK